jgi:prevent-host-death family protein
MRMVNTVELKNQTNEILRQVRRGSPIAVTLRGKPMVAIIPLTEDGVEDLAFEYSPALRQAIKEAEADIRAGRVTTWEGFLVHEEAHNAKRRSHRCHGRTR